MTEPYELVEPLTDEKSERIINLVLLLRSSNRGFTKTEIFRKIDLYRADLNFDNASMMFERDKAELLKAGINIDVYQADAYSEDEFRYRVIDSDALLPEIELTAAEVRLLSLALHGWKQTVHHSEAIQAQLKLEGLGHNLVDDLPVIEMTGNQHLPSLLNAIALRKTCSFDYVKPKDTEPLNRRINCWGVLMRGGQWFVYGFDLARNADRVFNLSRIVSDVKLVGTSNAYEVPTELKLDELFIPHFHNEKTTVKLQVAADSGQRWRSQAINSTLQTNQSGVIEVDLENLATEIPLLAAAAPGVVVLSPADVRSRVRALVLGGAK